MEVDVNTVEKLNRSLDYTIMWREDTQKRKTLVKLLQKRLQNKESVLLLPLVILCQTRLEVVDVMKCLDTEFATCSHASLTMETPFAERRKTVQNFQNNLLKILVSTPGIVGRGIELQAARCVGGLRVPFIRYCCGPSPPRFLNSFIMWVVWEERVRSATCACSVMHATRNSFLRS